MQAAQLDLVQQRVAALGQSPDVLEEIYREDVNIAVWHRDVAPSLTLAVSELLASRPSFKLMMTVSPQDVRDALIQQTANTLPQSLLDDVELMTRRFCDLFKLDQAKLRLDTLIHTMCPRFHVDRVPCRLITTYSSVATEWLPHDAVDRSKLGSKSNGVPDAMSGLYSQASDIQQVGCGDVALLKGELWPNNEDAGLVHRSPMVPMGETRLVLTLNVVKA